METESEKLCPGCGRAATLSTIYCGSCGHQFRTVFQETPDDNFSPQLPPKATWINSQWAPALLMVIPILAVIIWTHPWAAPNDRSVTNATASVNNTSTDPISQIHVGQTRDEVRGILGTPSSDSSTMDHGIWYYKLGQNRTIQINFNSGGIVESIGSS